MLKPVTAVWRWTEDRAARKQLLISPRSEGRLSSAEDVMEAGDRDAPAECSWDAGRKRK